MAGGVVYIKDYPVAGGPLRSTAFWSDTGTTAGNLTPIEQAGTGAPASVTALTGTSAVTALVGPFAPQLGRTINLMLTGTWAGTVQVLRSIDGGTTTQPLTVAGQGWASYTANCNEGFWEETEAAATFYLSIVRTSGTVNYRVSQ